MKGLQTALLVILLTLSSSGAEETKNPANGCKTRWFDRDNPTGTGDYELLSQLWDENPDKICPEPIAIEVQTLDGIPASKTKQQFSVNNPTEGFACINAQQGKGKSCFDYKVRFTCPESYCPPRLTPQVPVRPKTTFSPTKTSQAEPEETTESVTGGPTPQVPVRPKTTFPAPKTPHHEPEETTESFKGGPTPQVPVRPKTTFPAPKTPHPEPEETTESFKEGPTPQVPVGPKTTFPAPKTPHHEPEETTENFKGGPTPQVPVRPKTTFPAPKTPHPEPEETTESFKEGPTPQVPVGPKSTFPAPKTPHHEPEETTESFKGGENGGSGPETEALLEPSPTPDSECPQGSEKDDDQHECEEEEEEEGVTSPAPTLDSEQILTKGPQKGGEGPSTSGFKPITPQTLIPTPEQQQTTPVSEQVCYTRWFNQDDPVDSGDYELVADILYRNPSEMCLLPKAIEVQTLNGTPASETGQNFAVNQAKIGFICLNIMQGKGQWCHDYRVRFLCPQAFCSGGQEAITSPVPASPLEQVQSTPEIPVKGGQDQSPPGPNSTVGQVQSTPQSTEQESPSVCQTIWFNQDNPSGEGDQELLVDLQRLNPLQICSEPLEIEVQTIDGIRASETGQHFAINDANVGFSCINAEQGKGQRCQDYRVRFTCPWSFCKGSQELSTPRPALLTSPAPTSTMAQDQSAPQFPVEGSSLEPVTVLTPTTPEIKTGAQVEEQACKTAWFDRDDPSGTGDYELLPNLMDEHPDALCLHPVGIEVQTRDGVPASETGQHFAINDASHGFACINTQQGKGALCLDYRVRFFCPNSFCKKDQSEQSSTSFSPTTLEQTTSTPLQSSTQGQGQTELGTATPQSPAPVCKTKWINQDNPSGTGDFELVYYIRKSHPEALCVKPLAIEVQTVNGIPASQTGQIFARMDAINGFACINADQGKRGFCRDYKVRFVCPDSFCSGDDQKDENVKTG